MEYISEYLYDYIQTKTYKKYLPIPNIKSFGFEDHVKLRMIEQTIARIILDNPHPNVVSIYNITNQYIEMEHVNTKYMISPNIKELSDAKKYLQSKGIIYIDWKHDNIGLSSNGKFKVFDFDCAGLIDPSNPDEWLIEPVKYYAYKDAISNGYTKPLEIDDYCFTTNLL